MALTVVLNGVNYSIPEPSETGYGSALDSYLKALATAFPPLGGGLATLTAELDLGASFGLTSLYYKGRNANPAAAGILRLAGTDTIGWRNRGNSADVALAVDSGDALTFGGNNVTGNPCAIATTAAGQSIPNGATETIVVFGTEEADTDAAYNNSTGRFTVPTGKGGHYLVTGQIAYNTAPTGTCTASICKGGTAVRTTQFIAPGAGQTIQVSAHLLLVAGDIIDLRTKHGNAGAQSLTSTAAQNFLSIKRATT